MRGDQHGNADGKIGIGDRSVPQQANPANGAFASTVLGLMAIKRYGHAEEIAGMAVYLASPEAGYITGASLLIDGGFAA